MAQCLIKRRIRLHIVVISQARENYLTTVLLIRNSYLSTLYDFQLPLSLPNNLRIHEGLEYETGAIVNLS